MYPYDNDELDEEERALNAQIKVSLDNYLLYSNVLGKFRFEVQVSHMLIFKDITEYHPFCCRRL